MHFLKAGLMRRWQVQDLQLHPCDTDLEKHQFININIKFPPNTFMTTQDQQQYHFKISDARCLCYTQAHTHTHTHTR